MLQILLVLVVGLVIGGEFMYVAQRDREGETAAPEAMQAMQAQLDQRAGDLQFVRRQLDVAEGELAVERSMRENLTKQVGSQLDELGTLRDRLSFYEQLLPPGPGGVVSVRGLEFDRTAEGLRYRVLLMRSARSGSPPFMGSLQFVAEGTQDGHPKTLVLSLLRPVNPAASGAAPAAGSASAAATATPAAEAGQPGPGPSAGGKDAGSAPATSGAGKDAGSGVGAAAVGASAGKDAAVAPVMAAGAASSAAGHDTVQFRPVSARPGIVGPARGLRAGRHHAERARRRRGAGDPGREGAFLIAPTPCRCI